MNRDVKKIFSSAHTALARFDASVTAACSTYRAGKQRAKQEASRFKDEAAEYEARWKALADTAAAAIRDADKALCDELNLDIIPKLKEAMSDHITAKPSSAFLDTLRVYRDFDIPLSKAELNGLLTAADGNFTGIRALASVAAKSGYKLTFPGVDSYEADITRLERLARFPVAYVPMDYTTEGREIIPQRPVYRDDGSVAYSYDTDAIYFITRAGEFRGVWNSLEDTGNRWAAAIIPEVGSLEPIRDEATGEEISPEQQHAAAVKASVDQVAVDNTTAEDMAAALGQARAEESAKAAAILSQYTK